MTAFISLARRWLLPLTLTAALAAPQLAAASTIELFVPFEGAGNLSVFDAAAGTGGWVGSIDQTPPPVVPMPLSLVSVVLFSFDAATLTLNGTFEFTTTDLLSTLFGQVSGSATSADILSNGGQFSLDYTVLGGTGAFLDAHGFGLAFLNYDPAGGFNNYSEIGLLDLTVPEPTSLALVGVALLGMTGLARRKGLPR